MQTTQQECMVVSFYSEKSEQKSILLVPQLVNTKFNNFVYFMSFGIIGPIVVYLKMEFCPYIR